MRLTTLRPVPYGQSGLRGVACIASVSARVRRERRDESKRRGTLAPFAPALTVAQWLDWKRLLRGLFAEGKNRTACKLFSRLFAAFSCVLSSRIFENVTAKWTFCVQKFVFGQKLSPSNHYKAKSVTIAFFSSPPFFFPALSLLLSFSFVGVILEPIGPKKPALWRYKSTSWRAGQAFFFESLWIFYSWLFV